MMTYSPDKSDQPEHCCCVWCGNPLPTCECHPQHGQWLAAKFQGKPAGWVLVDSDLANCARLFPLLKLQDELEAQHLLDTLEPERRPLREGMAALDAAKKLLGE